MINTIDPATVGYYKFLTSDGRILNYFATSEAAAIHILDMDKKVFKNQNYKLKEFQNVDIKGSCDGEVKVF